MSVPQNIADQDIIFVTFIVVLHQCLELLREVHALGFVNFLEVLRFRGDAALRFLDYPLTTG